MCKVYCLVPVVFSIACVPSSGRILIVEDNSPVYQEREYRRPARYIELKDKIIIFVDETRKGGVIYEPYPSGESFMKLLVCYEKQHSEGILWTQNREEGGKARRYRISGLVRHGARFQIIGKYEEIEIKIEVHNALLVSRKRMQDVIRREFPSIAREINDCYEATGG